MKIDFHKYQGTGNDFIMIDDRSIQFPDDNQKLIHRLCQRRFGVGADGLILLRPSEDTDFKMVYFNADGKESTMCGNGGRCVVAFAYSLGIIEETTTFTAIDGLHQGQVLGSGDVKIEMIDVSNIEKDDNAWVLNTGSPHYITFVQNVESIDVDKIGRKIRNSSKYEKEGINVNFVEVMEDGLSMATYERGVEGETYSCGTGVTAAVLAANHSGLVKNNPIKVGTKGGNLKVYFQKEGTVYRHIWLQGPVKFVFSGHINLDYDQS